MRKPLIFIGAALALLVAGGVIAWAASFGPFAKPGAAVAAKKQTGDVGAPLANPESRFVTLDKLIVMLHSPQGSHVHYLLLDLVFQTDLKHEKQVKDQLPLLRSVAYRALSGFSVDEVRGMNVDQLVSVLRSAYVKTYGAVDSMPFAGVQIGRQMFE